MSGVTAHLPPTWKCGVANESCGSKTAWTRWPHCCVQNQKGQSVQWVSEGVWNNFFTPAPEMSHALHLKRELACTTEIQIPRNCQNNRLQVSSWIPRTFANFFGFPSKFCFCTDMSGSIEWPELAPRLQICDCFEIRNYHRGLCDFFVVKSRKFAARSTASPLRLLLGPL